MINKWRNSYNFLFFSRNRKISKQARKSFILILFVDSTIFRNKKWKKNNWTLLLRQIFKW